MNNLLFACALQIKIELGRTGNDQKILRTNMKTLA